MWVTALLLCALQSADFQSVLQAVQEQRWSAAQLALSNLEPGLERDQARVYLHHHAGDLRGAWAHAQSGLAAHPDDVFLRGRAVELALSLNMGAQAHALAAKLDPTGPEASGQQAARAAWDDEQRYQAAVQRARLIALLGMGLCLAVLFWASRSRSR